MVPPMFQKEARKCLGVMNYYCDMWPMRSHTLTPLTELASIERTFKWTEAEQYAFS